MLSTKLWGEGTVGISGVEFVGKKGTWWVFWEFNIIIQKVLTGLVID